jgi:hypothetical protein
MRGKLFSIVIPVALIILGVILMFLYVESGLYITGAGILWLIIAFLIGYKDDEPQPLGMGRGRKR